MKIWKQSFEIEATFKLDLPNSFKPSEIVLCEIQDGKPCFWFKAIPADSSKAFTFHIIGTGHPVPLDTEHCGSFQMPPYVWHLFVEKQR